MSDSTPPAAPSGGHAFPPPPPPPERKGMGGCLKYGLIGCGALVVLVILAIAAGAFWISRNQPGLEGSAEAAARDGARFGLQAEESECVEAAGTRTSDDGVFTAAVASGAFTSACLRYARETPGLCDDVPPPTAIRRSLEWQSERCAGDPACAQAVTAVQAYCADRGEKLTAADTLEWTAGGVRIEGIPAEDTVSP
jgi:hypothetical protein